jgi:hypothetical protein
MVLFFEECVPQPPRGSMGRTDETRREKTTAFICLCIYSSVFFLIPCFLLLSFR